MAMKRFNRTERVIGTTCIFWLQGRCNRNPCKFLHSETPSILSTGSCRDDTALYHNARKRCHISSEFAKTVSRRKTGNDMLSPKHTTKNKVWNRNLPKHTTKKVLNRNMGDEVPQKHTTKKVLNKNMGDEVPQKHTTKNMGDEVPQKHTTKNMGDEVPQKHTTKNMGDEVPQKHTTKNMGDEVPQKHTTKKVLNRNMGDERERTQVPQKTSISICKYWMNDNCVHGDQCRNLHSWSYGDGFATLAKLQGHKKLVTGIALLNGSDKLYSGSTDGTLRSWDCHTGQCANLMNLGAEATSLISEGPWIFVGLPNTVKAWNTETASQFTLDGPKGRVLSMTVGNDTLLAGAEDGVISAWKGSSKSNSPFELVASLRGHTKSVVCLIVGVVKILFSGSKDQSIKVWDLDTFECKMTLNAHTDEVTSLLCWDNFLLSGSLDCTVKVWYKTEAETLEVAYSHKLENGVVALSGMTDPKNKPILFCSTRDNSVRLYELPSFAERGRLFAKQEVGLIDIAPDGLFFTGDRTGLLTVWKWLEEPKVEVVASS
ncbi:unnamed protein product [Lathyrus sativus]|nr:unnamed protein product [Lathyrus sativus]